MRDDEELVQELEKLTTLHVVTLRYLAVLRAELRIVQGTVNAIQLSGGVSMDEQRAAYRSVHKKYADEELDKIEAWFLSKGITNERPGNDPWWDRPSSDDAAPRP